MTSTQTEKKKKRFTFDRRKLTIDPVPTILYYKDTNINDATDYDPYFLYKQSIPCQCSLCVRKREVVVSDNNKLIPLSVTDCSWDGCSFVLEINLKK